MNRLIKKNLLLIAPVFLLTACSTYNPRPPAVNLVSPAPIEIVDDYEVITRDIPKHKRPARPAPRKYNQGSAQNPSAPKNKGSVAMIQPAAYIPPNTN